MSEWTPEGSPPRAAMDRAGADGGVWPVWSPAGDELFYVGFTGVMALSFETAPTFTPGALTRLFERSIPGGPRRMAVSLDGQRFLMLTADGQAEGSRESALVVVQHWFEELRRLVPTN